MVDILLLLLLAGAGYLGWQRGLAVSLFAALVFVAVGLPVAALAAATGIVAPAAAFVIGGLLGLVPVALRIESIGDRLRASLAAPAWSVADRAGGALLNLGVVACGAWLVAAVAAVAPGGSSALTSLRSSAALSSLTEAVPPEGRLGVLVLRSGLVPAIDGPLVLAEAPDAASTLVPAVQAARSRVLQVRSTACGYLVTGTGWVAGPGIVVTNAHVVAGARRSFLAGGPRFDGAPARVTAFDPLNDVAVLVLEEGGGVLPPHLPVTSRVRHGERAAVIGFPRGREQLVGPARIDRVARHEVEPVGGGPAAEADVLALRASVQPGNSGGPIVAEDGSVLGMVVAKALGQRVDAAYGVPGATLLAAITEGARRVPAGTGSCIDEDGAARAPGASGRPPGALPPDSGVR